MHKWHQTPQAAFLCQITSVLDLSTWHLWLITSHGCLHRPRLLRDRIFTAVCGGHNLMLTVHLEPEITRLLGIIHMHVSCPVWPGLVVPAWYAVCRRRTRCQLSSSDWLIRRMPWTLIWTCLCRDRAGKRSVYAQDHSSGAVWESRWRSWAVRPNEPSGFRGRK